MLSRSRPISRDKRIPEPTRNAPRPPASTSRAVAGSGPKACADRAPGAARPEAGVGPSFTCAPLYCPSWRAGNDWEAFVDRARSIRRRWNQSVELRPADAFGTAPPGMAKVLVVDDEANLRKVLAAMLRRTGYEVTVAADGEQGLAEFQKSGADIVVTDLVMPKVGGMEILRSVNASNPDVP